MFSKNFGKFFFGCTEMKRIERGEGDLASSQPWFVAHETSLGSWHTKQPCLGLWHAKQFFVL
jgi:hypothetical protein